MSGGPLSLPVQKVTAYLRVSGDGPCILIPVGPQEQLVKFLKHLGAQISVLTQQDAEKLGMRSGQKRVKITSVKGVSFVCQTAKVDLWLLGENCMVTAHFAVQGDDENILGFDVLNRGTWCLPSGSMWSFSSNIDPNPGRSGEAAVRVPPAAPVLPD